MDRERDEVYERIPWETLEKKGADRQWLVYTVAGAIALGALAYSFMKNQPTAPPPAEAVATTAPAVTTTSNMGTTPSTVASPVVVAEADLFALDPERLIDQAAGHAEWVAVEYVAVDGSEQSRDVLSSLLPEGVPLPEAPEDTQVFVDWARARSVTQTGPVSFEVEVLVRSLLARDEEGFVRQPPFIVTVPVEVGDDGSTRLVGVPSIEMASPVPTEPVVMSQLPDDLAAEAESSGGEVIGGIESETGWEVVVMGEGPDGVRRPMTLRP